MAARFRKPEVDLVGKSAKKFGRDSGMGVLLLHHERNVVRDRICEREPGSISARSHHTHRRLAAHFAGDATPRRHRAANRLPVLPRTRTIERVQIEQLEGKSNLGQYIPLDPPLGTDEERFHAWIGLYQRARDRQPWIEVASCATAGEDDPHRAGSACRARGSVAATPNTFSRVLPMFTSIPVMTRERIRLERPYEMKGSVRPVVGSKPVATPI